MSDQYIEMLRKAQAHSLLIPRRPAAGLYLPAAIKAMNGEQVMVPQHQQSGLEQSVYLQYLPPITSSLSAFQSTGIQNGATKLCQFQFRQSDMIVSDAYLEIEINWPSFLTSAAVGAYSVLPGPLWLDRIEWNFNGGTPFQYLYGDIVFRALLMSMPPERLYQYALASGGWLNPPAMPGLVGAAALSTFNNYQTFSSGYTIFPFAPITASTGYPTGVAVVGTVGTNPGIYQKLRIPLIGSWLQAAGFFSFNYIDSGILYADVYCAGRPFYNTPNTGSDFVATTNLVSVNMLFRCLSFPGDSPQERALQTLNKGRSGFHIQYLDYVRNLASAPTLSQAPSATLNYTTDVYLDFTVGRHTAFLILIARNKGAFSTNNGTGWLLSPLATKDDGTTVLQIPDISQASVLGTAHQTNTKVCYLGQRTVWGDRSAGGLPACDIYNTNNQLVFSSGGVTSIEQWQNLLPSKLLPNNPWQMGVVPGQTTFAPLASSEIPIFFCNPLNALQGVYDGSQEFPVQYKLHLTFGQNALTSSTAVTDSITSYDIYAAQWRTLHFEANGKNNGPQIRVEEETAHKAQDV